MYNRFTTQLNASVNDCIPYKPKRPTFITPPWVKRCLLKNITEKKIYGKHKLTQTPQAYMNYLNLKREYEKKIRCQKREYEMKTSLGAKNIPMLLFGYVRSRKTSKHNTGPLLEKGKQISDDILIASCQIRPLVVCSQ